MSHQWVGRHGVDCDPACEGIGQSAAPNDLAHVGAHWPALVAVASHTYNAGNGGGALTNDATRSRGAVAADAESSFESHELLTKA